MARAITRHFCRMKPDDVSDGVAWPRRVARRHASVMKHASSRVLERLSAYCYFVFYLPPRLIFIFLSLVAITSERRRVTARMHAFYAQSDYDASHGARAPTLSR